MAGETLGALGDDSLVSQWQAALYAGAGSTFDKPRTSDTLTGDAITGSAPIDNSSGGSWSGFWQDTLKAVVGYTLAKDAQQSGVVTPVNASQQASQEARAAARPAWLLPAMLVAGGVLVYVVAKKAG